MRLWLVHVEMSELAVAHPLTRGEIVVVYPDYKGVYYLGSQTVHMLCVMLLGSGRAELYDDRLVV